MDVWSFKNGKAFLVGWQGDWPSHTSAGTQRGVEDLLCRLIDHLAVVGFEADSDTLFDFGFFSCSCHGAKGFPS